MGQAQKPRKLVPILLTFGMSDTHKLQSLRAGETLREHLFQPLQNQVEKWKAREGW